MSPVLLAIWRIDAAGTPPQGLPEAEKVRDVGRFCGAIVERVTRAHDVSEADRDELLGALLEKVVVLTRNYDPARRGIRFDLWLHQELGRDAIDFLRQWRGRNGEKVVADERLLFADRDLDDGDPALDQGAIAAEEDADPARAARALPDSWTDLRPDRARARSQRGLGLEPRADAA